MVAKMCFFICSLHWNCSKEPVWAGFSSIAAHWLLNNSWFHWPGGKKVLYTGAAILLRPPKTVFFSLLGVKEMTQYLILFTAVHQHRLKTHSQHSSRAAVPNPRAADGYKSVGHLVPGHTERKNNLLYFVLFII